MIPRLAVACRVFNRRVFNRRAFTGAALTLLLALGGCSASGGSPADSGAPFVDAGPDGGPDAGLAGLNPGEACIFDAQCGSENCGAAGHGNCCAFACDKRDPVCGALACDTVGACLYPDAGQPCAADRCENGQVASSSCDGQGLCAVTVSPCAGHLLCASDAGACPAHCQTSADCTPSFACQQGACVPLKLTGACDSNDVCQSGLCLPAGQVDAGAVGDGGRAPDGGAASGTCCASPCDTADPTCGAKSCDSVSGACNYPPSATYCLAACASSKLTAGTCGGPDHTCTEVTTVECPGLTVCADAASCKSSCKTADDCDQTIYPGGNQSLPNPNFCEPQSHTCCPAIPGYSGGTYSQNYNVVTSAAAVDPVVGNDFGCCGQAYPCRTLARAQQLYPRQVTAINAIGPVPAANSVLQSQTFTLSAGGSLDWPVDGGWPLVIDGTQGGLILVAYQPLFINPPDGWDGGAAIQLVSHLPASAGDDVSMRSLIVGTDSRGVQHDSAGIALDNGAFPAAGLDAGPDAGLLYNVAFLSMDEMWLNGSQTALRAGPGTTLSFRLPTFIGGGSAIPTDLSSGYWQGATWAYPSPITVHGRVGIDCNGATILDADDQRPYAVSIDSQAVADIDAHDGCSMTWRTTLALGTQRTAFGVGTCGARPDGIGIRATGPSRVVVQTCGAQQLYSSTLRCFSQFGVFEESTDAGDPYVELDNVVVANAGCAGAYVAGGQLVVDAQSSYCLNQFTDPGIAGTAFNDNLVGIWIPPDGGQVSLREGTLQYPSGAPYPYNGLSCDTAQEADSCPAEVAPPPVGIGLLNLSGQTVVADNGQWSQWDGTTTQYWSCSDSSYQLCSCSGPGCPGGSPGPLPANSDQGGGPNAVALNSNPQPFDFTGGQQTAEPLCR